jgi:integrase
MKKHGVYTIREYRPNHWQVTFTYQGKQIHLQKLPWGDPLDTDQNAHLLVMWLQRNGYHPEKWGRDTSFTFRKAIESWIGHSNISPEWLAQRKQIANRFFIPFFKSRDIRTIQTIHITEFFTWLKAKQYSLNYLGNLMGELRAFFRFHRKSLKELPDFPKIEAQEPVIKWLTFEEQDRVFQRISQPDLPVFEFMRRWGRRTNEASGLLKTNVHLDRNPAYFVVATVLGAAGQLKPYTKTKRIKVLPILEELKWIFEPTDGNDSGFVFAKKWRGEWRPYTNRMLNLIWNRANSTSGVTKVNLYNAMRHSFATQRLNQGYSLDEVRAILDHTTSKTTERYAQYQLQTLEGIIRGKIYTPFITTPDTKLLENKGINELGGKDSNLG